MAAISPSKSTPILCWKPALTIWCVRSIKPSLPIRLRIWFTGYASAVRQRWVLVAQVNTTSPLVLAGANAAKITTDFGTGANLQVRLNAKESGAAGIGIQVNVTSRDRGGPGAPTVTVAGKIISVELNSNVRNTSTVNDFVAAINGNTAASALVEARLISGIGATRLGCPVNQLLTIGIEWCDRRRDYSAYVGLGDTNREV